MKDLRCSIPDTREFYQHWTKKWGNMFAWKDMEFIVFNRYKLLQKNYYMYPG